MPRCEECSREFGTEEGLAQHRRDKHGEGGPTKHELKEKFREEKKQAQLTEQEKRLKAKKIKRIGIAAVVIILIVGVVWFFASATPANTPAVGPVGSTHIHPDMKLYLEGRAVDFTQSQYQLRSRYVHFEGGDGDVIHVHATGVKMGFFFDTLGIKFNSTCIAVAGKSHCNEADKTLKMFVNNEQSFDFEQYEPRDPDQILITYGNESSEEIAQQLASVTQKTGEAAAARGHGV